VPNIPHICQLRNISLSLGNETIIDAELNLIFNKNIKSMKKIAIKSRENSLLLKNGQIYKTFNIEINSTHVLVIIKKLNSYQILVKYLIK
jgi:hypothetical protein